MLSRWLQYHAKEHRFPMQRLSLLSDRCGRDFCWMPLLPDKVGQCVGWLSVRWFRILSEKFAHVGRTLGCILLLILAFYSYHYHSNLPFKCTDILQNLSPLTQIWNNNFKKEAWIFDCVHSRTNKHELWEMLIKHTTLKSTTKIMLTAVASFVHAIYISSNANQRT